MAKTATRDETREELLALRFKYADLERQLAEAQASATDLDAVAAEQQAELAEKAEWMRRTAVYEDSPRSTGGGIAERTRQ
jgi:hypothetical protein